MSSNKFTEAYNAKEHRYDVGKSAEECKRLMERKLASVREGRKRTLTYLNEDISQIPGESHQLEHKAFVLTRAACARINVDVKRFSEDAYGPVDFRVGTARDQDKVLRRQVKLRNSGGHPYNPDDIDIFQLTDLDKHQVYALPMRFIKDGQVVSFFSETTLMQEHLGCTAAWKEAHKQHLYDLKDEAGIQAYVDACVAAGQLPMLTDRQWYSDIITTNAKKFGSKKQMKIMNAAAKPASSESLTDISEVHYSRVVYGDTHTPVILTCPSHGDFLVKPVHHIHHRVKCYKCTEAITGGKIWLGNEGFIQRAKLLHGDLYDYSRVAYTNIDSAVEIGCPEHGFFSQIAWKHIGEGKGCCQCNRPRFTLEQWVAKAQRVHTRCNYDYSRVTYRGAHENVEIVCEQHGPWQMVAYCHLAGQGCPGCARHRYSKVAIEWLEYKMVVDKCFIHHSENGGEFKIPNSRYHADGYCAETNTIYELHGNFWHASPQLFSSEQIHPILLQPCGEIYQKTLDREAFIRAQGFQLVVMWEFEWKLVRLAVKKIQRAWRCHRRRQYIKKNIR